MLDSRKRLALSHGRIYTKEGALDIRWIEDWVGPSTDVCKLALLLMEKQPAHSSVATLLI